MANSLPVDQIATAALKECGVIATGETPSAADLQEARDALNGVLASLPMFGVSLSDISPESIFTTWIISTEAQTTWTYGLGFWVASEICGKFEVPLQKQQDINARGAYWRDLLLKYVPDNAPIFFTVDNG
ncbi:hypothetical protein [Cupriavidus taiwanensis]|uniref:hypothetical protein n=1 Tax=Cupriavidus taiwanensis TaxID=164546 RepID=UPI000E17DC09|nr:hypothetical protein [Cupriavidus taiwanensis]SPA44606.1 hypothetical protein CBM2629_A150408 [Cupriavidus taiwanensis]